MTNKLIFCIVLFNYKYSDNIATGQRLRSLQLVYRIIPTLEEEEKEGGGKVKGGEKEEYMEKGRYIRKGGKKKRNK